jgi:uncharacterized membrane protein YdjX (TVP38/TMEM64 family)
MRKHTKIIILLFLIIGVIALARYSPLSTVLTFENLKQHRLSLQAFVHENYGVSLLTFIAVYVLVAALSIPGAVILTLAGGFLFNTIVATAAVNIGATAGAVLSFLTARYLLGNLLQEKYREQLLKFNQELDRNGGRYLLTLRLIPLFPFFMINFLSGLTKIPITTFVWTTSLGIVPGTVVFAFAGQQLGSINTLSEILSGKVLAAFAVTAFFTLLPVVLDRVHAARKKPGL